MYKICSISIQLIFFILVSCKVLGQSSKIMSYNIRYDGGSDVENKWQDRKEKLVQLLIHHQPSIIGTQEGLLHQIKYLDSCLVDYNYIGTGRGDGKEKGEFCAVFYNANKYRVIESSTFWLSESPERTSIGWDAALERICTYGLFEDLQTKDSLWIFNTHFDHIGKLARENSAKLILDQINKINSRKLPIVFMGDLNVTPDEKVIEIIKTNLTDGLEITKNPLSGPTGTFNGFSEDVPERRIDYIFTDQLKVLTYDHIDARLSNNKHISDHFPVLITTVLSKTKN